MVGNTIQAHNVAQRMGIEEMSEGPLRLSDMRLSEIAVASSLCKQSFFDFILEHWDSIIAETFVYNWHIEFLANEMQRVAERVFEGLPRLYDLVINISPGTTKSTIATIMFPAWVWTRMPTARFICASYASSLSMQHSLKGRDLVWSDRYRAYYPGIVLREDQATKTLFMNTQGGLRFSTGVGSAVVTGMHGHFLLVDDPLNPNEAASELELRAANRWMSETLPTRKVDKEVCPTILIMQRLHQDDPTQNMLDRSDSLNPVRHICLPAELTDIVKPKSLRKYYIGGLMDPKRLSKRVLDGYLKELGNYGYAGQLLQTPIPYGGGMFRVECVQIVTSPPKHIKQLVRFWDKAGTPGGGAFTVGTLMARAVDDTYWILDVRRGQWSSDAREVVIKSTAELDGYDVVIGLEQEPGSGGKESAEATVRNLAGWRVRIDRPTGDKAARADPFSVQLNAGNVRMLRAEWNKDWLNEYAYFPFSKYKDQVDSGSGAFNLLSRGRRRVGALRGRKRA